MSASESLRLNLSPAGRAAQVAAAGAPDVASHRRGQSLIELAIVLPLLVVIVLLALDLGRAFFAQVALRGAAEYGVRYAANFPTKLDQYIIEEVKKEPGTSLDAANIGIITVTSPRSPGLPVTVTVPYTFHFFSPFSTVLAGGNDHLDLQGKATSVVISGAVP